MRPRSVPVVVLALLVCLVPARLVGQEGDAWTVVGGVALGFTSGSVLGTVGGLMPCGYALSPDRCTGIWAVSGAAIGGLAGYRVGRFDPSRIGELGKSAAIGVGAGLVVGAAIAPFVNYYGWRDVIAVGFIGGSIGASPTGAAIGLGVGLATGTVLWLVLDQVTTQDLLQTAMLGLAVGGLSGWAAEGLEAQLTLPALSLEF